MTAAIIFVLFVLTIVAALVALRVKDLLASAAVLSVFSFVVSLLYIALGAVDVGFNEAVLGAGVSGVLFLVAIYQTARSYRGSHHGLLGYGVDRRFGESLVRLLLIALGGLLLYAGTGLPEFGDPLAPAALHVSDDYIERAYHDDHTPNIVTVMIADYRSFDTFGETVVVFTAGMACFFLLRRRRALP